MRSKYDKKKNQGHVKHKFKEMSDNKELGKEMSDIKWVRDWKG